MDEQLINDVSLSLTLVVSMFNFIENHSMSETQEIQTLPSNDHRSPTHQRFLSPDLSFPPSIHTAANGSLMAHMSHMGGKGTTSKSLVK